MLEQQCVVLTTLLELQVMSIIADDNNVQILVCHVRDREVRGCDLELPIIPQKN